MTSRLLAVTHAVRDPVGVAGFWAALLGREVVADGTGVLLPGDATRVGLRFAPGRAGGSGPGLVHLHVSSEGSDLESVVARAVGLGASHLDVGQRPEEPHVVLADPGGHEFCVIPPDSSFLAGCGVLGEVACDGTRAVGVLWAAALGWPLVWDREGETAVQSPHGGTTVAWGGPPLAPLEVPARHWFELVADPAGGVDVEVERLVALGATRVAGTADDGAVVLRDPDGHELRLRTR